MRDNFKNKLIEWKNSTFYNETKTIKAAKILQSDGTYEYRIELKMSVNVRVAHHSKPIVETEKFYTQAQSPNTEKNPNGDIFVFETFAKTLIERFYNEYNKTVDDFLQDITPDGFLNI